MPQVGAVGDLAEVDDAVAGQDPAGGAAVGGFEGGEQGHGDDGDEGAAGDGVEAGPGGGHGHQGGEGDAGGQRPALGRRARRAMTAGVRASRAPARSW